MRIVNGMRIGFISALRAEIRTLAFLMEQRNDQASCLFETCGQGPQKASDAAKRLVAKKCDLLISWGVAGALDPALKNGDLIVSNHSISEKGQEIRSRKNTAKYYIDRLENVVPVTSGKIVTVREVATSAKKKKSLFQRYKADIVDMESHSIAEVAEESGTDFLFVRAVTDEASHDLPKSFIECADEFGTPKPLKILGVICLQPYKIRSFFRLGAEFRTSLKTLRLASRSFGKI